MSARAGLHARGKVRDVYEAGDDLLLVATDRISAFDVVLPDPIPDKGRVLTGLSLFWFDRTTDLVRNHLLSADRAAFPAPFADEPSLAGRSMLVTRARGDPRRMRRARLPHGLGAEAVPARGRGLRRAAARRAWPSRDRLPEPIFTPTTKAAEGHDLPLTLEETVDLVGRSGSPSACASSPSRIYERGADVALRARDHRWPTRSSSSGSRAAS